MYMACQVVVSEPVCNCLILLLHRGHGNVAGVITDKDSEDEDDFIAKDEEAVPEPLPTQVTVMHPEQYI